MDHRTVVDAEEQVSTLHRVRGLNWGLCACVGICIAFWASIVRGLTEFL